METDELSRRMLLTTAGGSLMATAGCLGDESEPTSEQTTETASPTQTPKSSTTEPPETAHTTEATETESTPETPAWEVEADARIEQHRMGSLNVEVENEGEPVEDASVTVTQQSHEYGFGTAVNPERLFELSADGEKYRGHLKDLFNMGVFQNAHKWGPWENDETRELADRGVEWLLDEGFDVRGHTCIWQTDQFEYYQYPDDVLEAIENENAEKLRTRSINHVDRIVSHYEGQVAEWDVVNEQLNHSGLTEVVNPDADPTKAPILIDWYKTAKAADPNATLYANEYDIINGNSPGKADRYAEMVEFLNSNGADVGGMGMQSHHFGGLTQEPEDILAVCDTLADAGDVELAVTEYDTPSHKGEPAATYLHMFLKTFFSHPATARFVVWNFWDNEHWTENAPFFNADWSKKPAYDVWVSLVFEEWWTEETGTTDSDGHYQTAAMLGEHEVTVMTEEQEVTEEISVSTSDGVTSVTIALEDYS